MFTISVRPCLSAIDNGVSPAYKVIIEPIIVMIIYKREHVTEWAKNPNQENLLIESGHTIRV